MTQGYGTGLPSSSWGAWWSCGAHREFLHPARIEAGRSSHPRQNTHEAKTQSRRTGLDTACETVGLALLGGAPWELQAVQV